MSAPDEELRRDARVAASLDADPALEAELEVMLRALSQERRARFLAALAVEIDRHERPAAAVLAALSTAARG